MTNFSKTSPSPAEEGPQYDNLNNSTWIPSSSNDGLAQYLNALTSVFAVCACIIGLVGNGAVIYLLGFHIKRSPFTTYILNLAVADFGVLFFGLIYISAIDEAKSVYLYTIVHMAAPFMHSTSQLLLTAISIDRCVSIALPIWHRCHRPPRLSTTVCAVIWVLSCLPSGSLAILHTLRYFKNDIFLFQFILVAILCLPLVTVSTLILFFKVFCKPQQPRRGRLLTIVLLTLLLFLIFAFPLNAIFSLNYFTRWEYIYLTEYGYFCAYLNSCVNPVIYFMVGRKKRAQQRESLKILLQRAFQEGKEHKEEGGTTAETSL